MARWRRALGIAFLLIILLFGVGITFTIGWRPFIGPAARPLTDRRFEPSPERLARGRYLFEALSGCVACHSDPDTSVEGLPALAGTKGAGRVWAAEGTPWLVAPNITPDRDTGVGSWNDDTLARAIREGIGHDGRALFPIMPYPQYRNMSDEDLASIIVYLRSLPAVARPLPRTEIPFPLNRLINSVPAPVTDPVAAPDLSQPVTRGRYVAAMAVCTDCHTPIDQRGQRIPGLEFAGGLPLQNAAGSATSTNLTPDPSGIPYYTEELFLEAMRTGYVKARKLDSNMPWAFYRHMTDEDLKAVFAYLQTLTPVRHSVDNSLPPTDCVLCGSRHGAGERNQKE